MAISCSLSISPQPYRITLDTMLSCSVMSDSATPTLCNPLFMRILQTRIMEWVAMPLSRGSSQPRYQTQVTCIEGGFFTISATRAAHRLTLCILKSLLSFLCPLTSPLFLLYNASCCILSEFSVICSIFIYSLPDFMFRRIWALKWVQ